jgi:serine/threonine-protein kinase
VNCPACGAANDGASEHCFSCGKTLFALTEGTVVAGRYELRQMLGRGGMGIVYRAYDKALEEEVALKVLRPDVASMAELTRRFRSEIKLARRVRHRNVCGIHEYGQDGPIHFIAMELLQGTDLKRQMQKQGRFPVAEAFDVAIQVAEGLDAIHHADVVHRDLKAHNIMRDERGVVRVMDFGIAKALGMSGGGATVTGQIIGTPEYMSPEQARGDQIDFRSDIYALGVVIFEIFTGSVPFHGDTPIATLFKHIQEPPPIDGRQGIPPALVPVLHKALAKDPAQRYASAREMADALRAARDAEAAKGAGQTMVLAPTAKASAVRAPDTAVPAAPTELRAPRPSPPPPPPPRAARATAPAPPPARREEQRGLPLPLLVGVGLLGAVLLAGALFLFTRAPQEPGVASVTTLPAPPPTLAEPPAGSAVEPSLPPAALTPATTPASVAPPVAEPPAVVRPQTTVAPFVPPTTRPAQAAPVTRPPAPTPPPTTLPAVAQGTVRLRVLPWAEVEIDGVYKGTTPLRPIPLPAGTHTLRFTHPDFRPLIKRIIVPAGDEVALEVDLGREAFPR